MSILIKNIILRHKVTIKYLLSGGSNTVICFLLFWLLIHLKVNYLVSNAIAFIYGVVQGYLFNCLFVFHTKPKITSLLKYSSIYSITLLISLTLMYTWVSVFSINELIANILTTIVVTVINFKLIKLLVFK